MSTTSFMDSPNSYSTTVDDQRPGLNGSSLHGSSTLGALTAAGTPQKFIWAVISMGAVGTLANGLMFVVLAYFKQNREKPTNVLILNQTIMDLLSCVALAFSYALQVSPPHYENTKAWMAVCLLFRGSIILGFGMVGSIVGIVMIAVERYAKIVHSILHKKYYRVWMLYVAVLIPWAYAGVTVIPVMTTTTRIIEGNCYPQSFYPYPSDRLAYGIACVLGNYILPIVIFVYCYGRIALVLGQRTKVIPASNPGESKIISKTSARHSSVIKTMITISVLFAVAWLPIQVYFMMMNDGYLLNTTSNIWYFSVFASYSCSIVNPVLYAWQYDTVRKSVMVLWRKMFGLAGSKEEMFSEQTQSVDIKTRPMISVA